MSHKLRIFAAAVMLMTAPAVSMAASGGGSGGGSGNSGGGHSGGGHAGGGDHGGSGNAHGGGMGGLGARGAAMSAHLAALSHGSARTAAPRATLAKLPGKPGPTPHHHGALRYPWNPGDDYLPPFMDGCIPDRSLTNLGFGCYSPEKARTTRG